jgi:hypothetical protein
VARPGSFTAGNRVASKAANPRGRFITQRLIAMMHEEVTTMRVDPTDPKKKRMIQERTTRLVMYCHKIFELALDGDMQAIKYIADRIEGTPIATTVSIEEFDPEKMDAERRRLATTRENLAKMTDAERTTLYFATLAEARGASGSSSKSH